MLEIRLGRLKHDMGFRMPVQLQGACDTLAYGYGEIALAGPLDFLGFAENTGPEIQVQGQLQAQLSLICSRCGLPFSLSLQLDFKESYSNQELAPDQDGLQDKHSFRGDTIDITPEALRLLFAELPMKPLCREDCRGLCPSCGKDLNQGECGCAQENIDPRWEKLRAFIEVFDDSQKGV